MNKKLIILFTIIGLILIGGVVGFIYYRNTPDYVMKQYVKANNSKNQKILKKISYDSDKYDFYDIQNAYDIGLTNKISSYSIKDKTKDKIDNTKDKIKKEVLNTNDKVNNVLIYTIVFEDNKSSFVILIQVNNKWKVGLCSLFNFK